MSKTVILLIGHGSRNPQGNDEFLDFAARLARRQPEHTFVTCFIEFHDVLVPDGIDRAVALGATRIIAVPVILLAAGHVKMEIPEFIEAARERHPGVEIHYARNIGVTDAAVDMLVDRVAGVHAATPLAPDDTGILILGRGSSDPDANGDLAKITRLFWEKTPYDRVEYAFIGITRPDFPSGVARLVRLGAKTVVIAPYFLFTGVLMDRILRMTDEFRATYPETRFAVAKYFEFHENLFQVVMERISEVETARTTMMACDNCTYRILAAHHGEHHHHH